MAVGVMRAAADLGLAIPSNLSVVGFDDIPLAKFSIPALTTITQPATQIGVIATDYLIKRIRNQDLVSVTDFSPLRSHLYLVAGFRWQVARFYLPPETCHLPPFQVAKN